jgi:23S rRNA (guanine745-N1)-methyltransferase
MTFILYSALRCPIEASPLAIDGASLVCEHGHRFDVARQGYVNLLGPKDKRSKDPGDSKKMVLARTAFLGADFYQPLADACLDITLDYCSRVADGHITLMDAGCGDGYYLHHVQKNLSHNLRGRISLVGFDISKWAVQQSAKRCDGTWFVGSNRHIPMANSSVDLLFDMFGFPDYSSFLRVLAPGGRLVRLTPGDQHLIQLREIIYPNIKSPTERSSYPEILRVVAEKRISYEMTLGSEDLNNLLLMTPHMFRSTPERRQQALNHDQLSLTVDVVIEELIPTTA